MLAINLFAGAGGWCTAARDLGLGVIGIENDPDTVRTRLSNRHRTLAADVTQCDVMLGDGLIASPPCPSFSNAGLRHGLRDVYALADLVVAPRSRTTVLDPQAALVLEPKRWIEDALLAGEPYRWVAMEQVPAVLPIWQAYWKLLTDWGYSVVAALVQCADYGVPQTRERAILLASKDRVVGRYPEAEWPVRVSARVGACRGGRVPWPSGGLLGFPRRDDGRGKQLPAVINGVAYRGRDLRSVDEPAFTLTEKARSWTRFDPDGSRHRLELDEAAALQTFPEGYIWCGSRTSQFLQVANAVPPRLARILLQELL